MSKHLEVKFASSFSQDLKRLSKRHDRNTDDLAEVIDPVAENSKESTDILKQRHNMHRLSGSWKGRCECHVANAGDWLVIWSADDKLAIFERTGSHDELFR